AGWRCCRSRPRAAEPDGRRGARHSGDLHAAIDTLDAPYRPMIDMLPSRPPCGRAILAVLLVASLAACGMGRAKEPPPPLGETFSAEDTYSRSFESWPPAACEATRRALLGQGYVISEATGDSLQAIKNFHP